MSGTTTKIFRQPKGYAWRYREVRRFRPDPYDPSLGRLVAWGEFRKKVARP